MCNIFLPRVSRCQNHVLPLFLAGRLANFVGQSNMLLVPILFATSKLELYLRFSPALPLPVHLARQDPGRQSVFLQRNHPTNKISYIVLYLIHCLCNIHDFLNLKHHHSVNGCPNGTKMLVNNTTTIIRHSHHEFAETMVRFAPAPFTCFYVTSTTLSRSPPTTPPIRSSPPGFVRSVNKDDNVNWDDFIVETKIDARLLKLDEHMRGVLGILDKISIRQT